MTFEPGEHLMHRDLESLPLWELTARFHRPAPEGRRYSLAYYEDVALAVRKHGQVGVHFLVRELQQADTDHARAILFALGWPPELPEAHALLRARIYDRRPLVVMEAIDSLWRLRDREVRNRVTALRQHRSPYVRGAVLRYLSKLFPDEALPELLAALHDRHYIVRESAIDELDEMPAIAALSAIRPLLNDPHPHVRQAAETAIKHLEGYLEGSNSEEGDGAGNEAEDS